MLVYDEEGVKQSADITAGSLFEAAVVGMTAMKVPAWFNRSTMTIEITCAAAGKRSTRCPMQSDGVADAESW
jgi:hypothetical protein